MFKTGDAISHKKNPKQKMTVEYHVLPDKLRVVYWDGKQFRRKTFHNKSHLFDLNIKNGNGEWQLVVNKENNI